MRKMINRWLWWLRSEWAWVKSEVRREAAEKRSVDDPEYDEEVERGLDALVKSAHGRPEGVTLETVIGERRSALERSDRDR